MKISMLENGIDSLQRGFESLTEYELSKIDNPNDNSDYYLLKNAVVYIHHGIEILMKYILSKESEFLIFSSIDKNVKNAYNEKRQKNLESVFQTALRNKVHTVSYEEAYERLKYLCGHKFSKKVEEQILELNNIRNQITHSEIFMEESEVINLFDNFLDEIDMYFFSKIGKNYKTMSGYSELVSNYGKYIESLESKGAYLKKKAVESYYNILKKYNLGMGFNEVKRITDINLAVNIIKDLYKEEFKFGTDLYNSYCSGNVSKIDRIGKEHISIFTQDNNAEFRFKFKSMIIFMPSILSNFSPILVFESDDDIVKDKEHIKYIYKDCYEKEVLNGIYFYEDNSYTYDGEKVNEFYMMLDYNEDFIVPAYHTVERFLTKGIFAHINIQGLSFGNFKKIIEQARDMDGKTFEILLNQMVKAKDN